MKNFIKSYGIHILEQMIKVGYLSMFFLFITNVLHFNIEDILEFLVYPIVLVITLFSMLYYDKKILPQIYFRHIDICISTYFVILGSYSAEYSMYLLIYIICASAIDAYSGRKYLEEELNLIPRLQNKKEDRKK